MIKDVLPGQSVAQVWVEAAELSVSGPVDKK